MGITEIVTNGQPLKENYMVTSKRGTKVTKTQARKLLRAFNRGEVSKLALDIQLGEPTQRGKFVTRVWREELGVVV